MNKFYRSRVLLVWALNLCACFFISCGGGGGGSSKCGGPSGALCKLGEFCDYKDFSCGSSGLEGECTLIPLDCKIAGAYLTELSGPVCSCEGLDFFTPCDAAAAQQAIRGAGDC